MKRTRNVVLGVALVAAACSLAACNAPQTPPQAGGTTAARAAPLEVIEIIARPAGETQGSFSRPTSPSDAIVIAMRTKGSTREADLSVKMIALADGSVVENRQLKLNAGNSAAPSFQFKPAPAGRYLFEVSLDGKLAGSQELEVFPADMVTAAGG
jgi:hypothetical protein